MKTRLFFLFALIGLAFTLDGCGSDDDWEPMYWLGYPKKSAIVVNVDAEGGTDTLRCTNYRYFFVSGVMTYADASDSEHWASYMVQQSGTGDSLTCTADADFATLRSKGAQLLVTLSPNDSGKERAVAVTVDAPVPDKMGDRITFVQAAK